ncbi:MAG TPA: OmpA family protein [Stellaceae bacterium]|nr:OmpA family protein [Stellaceae bacterium]
MRGAPGAAGRPARAAAEGGDYFASMTDLMLGLIFIFIIMLVGFAMNLHSAESRIETQLRPSESLLARREMLHDVARILKGVLPVTIDEENGTLQLGGDILFPQGSADTYADALPKLKLLARALDLVLPCYAVAPDSGPLAQCAGKAKGRLDAVYVEGHSDATPIRTERFANNWDLSAARATEAFKRLVGYVPELAKLANDRGERLIGVSGYGATRPVDESKTPRAMQRNRRIELRFIMARSATPQLDAMTGLVDEARKP